MFLIEWWNSLTIALQVFYCIAIPSTLLLLVQTVMTFIGLDNESEAGDLGDSGSDVDADIDSEGDLDLSGVDGLRIFTIRGLIAFFVVFGWVGVVMEGSKVPLIITILVSAVSGFAIMVILAYLFKAVLKLRSDGNTDNRNALGTSGKVHLTIPANRKGEGKVHLMLQGTYVERNAVTDNNEPIPTGSEVIVVGISGQTDLIVKPK